MSTSVAVTSGKGGTGKTSFTAAVGSCLAALGQRALCIDMDIGLRNLDIALGMSDLAVMDFTDVIEGRCAFERAVVGAPEDPWTFPSHRSLYPSPGPHPPACRRSGGTGQGGL